MTEKNKKDGGDSSSSSDYVINDIGKIPGVKSNEDMWTKTIVGDGGTLKSLGIDEQDYAEKIFPIKPEKETLNYNFRLNDLLAFLNKCDRIIFFTEEHDLTELHYMRAENSSRSISIFINFTRQDYSSFLYVGKRKNDINVGVRNEFKNILLNLFSSTVCYKIFNNELNYSEISLNSVLNFSHKPTSFEKVLEYLLGQPKENIIDVLEESDAQIDIRKGAGFK